MANEALAGMEAALVSEIALILNRGASDIDIDVPLNELGVDSLNFVELLVTIEKKFGISLMESGLSKKDFRTVRTLAGYLEGMRT